MAITNTRLAAAASKADDSFKVLSSAGASVNGYMKVDNEYSVITQMNVPANTITVRARGDRGGRVVPHAVNAPVQFGVATDLPEWMYGTGSADVDDVMSVSAAGAIPLPMRHTKVLLNGTAITAYTLAAPSGVPDGVRLTLIQDTNFAHTVAITGAGSTFDLLTCLATGGGVAVLESLNQTWKLVSSGSITVA